VGYNDDGPNVVLLPRRCGALPFATAIMRASQDEAIDARVEVGAHGWNAPAMLKIMSLRTPDLAAIPPRSTAMYVTGMVFRIERWRAP
jgi:hypothetical protein